MVEKGSGALRRGGFGRLSLGLWRWRLVRGGFTGGGKGVLEAGDEISLAYVRNQTVRGAGDIVIAKEAGLTGAAALGSA